MVQSQILNRRLQIAKRKSQITNSSPDHRISPSPHHPIHQRAVQILLAADFVSFTAAPGAEAVFLRIACVLFFKAARAALPASSASAMAVPLASEVF
jgi:hypothetical protein